MEYMINNWYLFVALLAMVSFVAIEFIRRRALPTEEQLSQLVELLKYAVTEAEKKFGSKMGQLKLREVYAYIISKLPWVAKLISFEAFSGYVDDALEWMRIEIDKNPAFKNYVFGCK